MGQQIGSLINDLIILGIFVYLSLLVSGRLKMKPHKQEKFDSMMKARGSWFKPLVYIGTGIFAVLLITQFLKF